VIPFQVTENARLNPRTRLPDTRLLLASSDPAQYPLRKDDITLPPSTGDYNWIWMAPWTPLTSAKTNDEGWRFAQRWNTDEEQWSGNPGSLTPVTRAGLVARRTLIRIAKQIPSTHPNIATTTPPPTTSSTAPVSSTDRVSTPATRLVPTTRGSMAKLVGLMTSKGK